jgi:hypothetical protein
MWTYYQQTYANGDWSLFREADGQNAERYHRQNGWMPTNELIIRKFKGDIGADDIVSEETADALIQSLSKRFEVEPGAPQGVPGYPTLPG